MKISKKIKVRLHYINFITFLKEISKFLVIMVHFIQIQSTKLVPVNRRIIETARYFSQHLNKDACSRAVRQKFLNYFINENNHKFIKSSPVIPFCDPSIAFVNAGMNQVSCHSV